MVVIPSKKNENTNSYSITSTENQKNEWKLTYSSYLEKGMKSITFRTLHDHFKGLICGSVYSESQRYGKCYSKELGSSPGGGCHRF